jgi:hypothetical protein
MQRVVQLADDLLAGSQIIGNHRRTGGRRGTRWMGNSRRQVSILPDLVYLLYTTQLPQNK